MNNVVDVWLRRTAIGLELSDPEDMPKGWRIGDQLLASIRKPRNAKLHRKAFILIDVVYPHTEYPSKEALRKAMTVGAGFVEEIINPVTGETALSAKSWRFDSMDDIEFQQLYSAMIGVALKIVEGSTHDDWMNAVEEIARL